MASDICQPRQPVATYLPTEQEFRDISNCAHVSKSFVPPGFPPQLEGSLVWDGGAEETCLDTSPEVVKLSPSDVESIEAALRHFHALGASPSDLSPETFPLPATLTRKLDGLANALYSGSGYTLLRGLEPLKYTEAQNSLIFAGLASHVASDRAFQDLKKENVLCHIVNQRGHTPAFSDGQVAFHTDTGEILALYALKAARKGGAMLLSSIGHIYNDLAQNHPGVLQTLADDWVFDMHQELTDHPPFTRPILLTEGDRVTAQLSHYRLTGFGSRPRSEAIPALSDRQAQALDAFQLAAMRSCRKLTMRSGDIVFVNNLAIVHGREPFCANDEDGSEADGGRHLLRLLLRDPKRSCGIPHVLQPVWKDIYGPNRSDGSRVERWILDNTDGASQWQEWSGNG